MGRVIVFLAEGDAVLPAFEAVRDMIAKMGPASNGQSPVETLRIAERATESVASVNDDLPDEDETEHIEADDELEPMVRTVAPVNEDVDVKVLRAVLNSDGKAGSIGKAIELGANNQLLKKLRVQGLLAMTGEKSAARWSVTKAGLMKMSDVAPDNAAVTDKQNVGNWSPAATRLYAFLTKLDRPCRISGVIDELEMSRTVFDRAVGREEFTVKGEFVELTP